MPYKDPHKQRLFETNWQRERRKKRREEIKVKFGSNRMECGSSIEEPWIVAPLISVQFRAFPPFLFLTLKHF
jgi:hypothetical protein